MLQEHLTLGKVRMSARHMGDEAEWGETVLLLEPRSTSAPRCLAGNLTLPISISDPTKLNLRDSVSHLYATAQAKVKKSVFVALGTLQPWIFSPINWCTQKVELSLICSMTVYMLLCCMVALSLCNVMALGRETQMSNQNPWFSLLYASLTET